MKPPRPELSKDYFKIFVSFILLGPLIGWMVSVLIFVGGAFIGDQPKDVPTYIVAVLTLGIPFAYAFGLVPAIVAGAVLVTLEAKYRAMPIWVVVILGIIIGCISIMLLYYMRQTTPRIWFAAIFLGAAISTPVSWYFLRLRGRVAR